MIVQCALARRSKRIRPISVKAPALQIGPVVPPPLRREQQHCRNRSSNFTDCLQVHKCATAFAEGRKVKDLRKDVVVPKGCGRSSRIMRKNASVVGRDANRRCLQFMRIPCDQVTLACNNNARKNVQCGSISSSVTSQAQPHGSVKRTFPQSDAAMRLSLRNRSPNVQARTATSAARY